jgi:glycosyltransferase involved in cell wall biosynthesis
LFPVSVVIVTKDEEKNIEDALKSVADADEIIIVDCFSADRTVEICRAYTDKIYQHEWRGFAGQKQLAVDYAAGPWVLLLDADERVTPELKKEIAGKTSHSSQPVPHDYYGFYLPRKNFFLGKWIRHSGWWPDYTLRLFRKDKAALEDREVHEKVLVDGPTAYLKNPLEHYTYRTIPDFLRKMENYSSLAAREIRKKSGGPGVISVAVRPVFTFIKMFFFRLGFLDGAYGLLLALLYSYYTFLKYVKALEREL